MAFGLEGLRGTAAVTRGLREILQERYTRAQDERKQQMEERRQTEAERAARANEALLGQRYQQDQTQQERSYLLDLAKLIPINTALPPTTGKALQPFGLSRENAPNTNFPPGVEPLGGPPIYIPGRQPGFVATGTAGAQEEAERLRLQRERDISLEGNREAIQARLQEAAQRVADFQFQRNELQQQRNDISLKATLGQIEAATARNEITRLNAETQRLQVELNQYLADPEVQRVLAAQRAAGTVEGQGGTGLFTQPVPPVPPGLRPPGRGGPGTIGPQKGDTKPIAGFPGAEQTFDGTRWIRTK